MPSLTECVDHFKAEIQKIAQNQPMQQCYDGVGNPFFTFDKDDDITHAKQFSEAMQIQTLPHGQTLGNPYPQKALQCAWNIADILSEVIRYAPSEWSAGFFRGLTAKGVNGDMNAYNILASMNYLDPDNTVSIPYIVDDITYQINCAFLTFIKEVQLTRNGRSLLSWIQQISNSYLGEPILLDQLIITTAEARIKAYETYQLHQSSAPASQTQVCEQYKADLSSLKSPTPEEDIYEDEEGFVFYDARTGEEDAQPEEQQLKKDIETETVHFLIETTRLLHANHDDLDQDYNLTTESLVYLISDVVLDPTATVERMRDAVIDNKPIDAFLEKNKSKNWIQSIKIAFDSLKQKIHQLIEACRFETPKPS